MPTENIELDRKCTERKNIPVYVFTKDLLSELFD